MSYRTNTDTERRSWDGHIVDKENSRVIRRLNDKRAVREAIKEMKAEEEDKALEQMCKELDEDLGFMDDFYINREMDAVLEAMDGGLADEELPFYNDEDFYYDF